MNDPIGGIAAARDRGLKPGCFNPNQYENPAVSKLANHFETVITADQRKVHLNLRISGLTSDGRVLKSTNSCPRLK
jgi:hypothetical protein